MHRVRNAWRVLSRRTLAHEVAAAGVDIRRLGYVGFAAKAEHPALRAPPCAPPSVPSPPCPALCPALCTGLCINVCPALCPALCTTLRTTLCTAPTLRRAFSAHTHTHLPSPPSLPTLPTLSLARRFT